MLWRVHCQIGPTFRRRGGAERGTLALVKRLHAMYLSWLQSQLMRMAASSLLAPSDRS